MTETDAAILAVIKGNKKIFVCGLKGKSVFYL